MVRVDGGAAPVGVCLLELVRGEDHLAGVGGAAVESCADAGAEAVDVAVGGGGCPVAGLAAGVDVGESCAFELEDEVVEECGSE